MERSSTAASKAPRAETPSGTLEGLRIGPVNAFLGLPYAAAPVDDLRWCAPQALAPWSGVRPATCFGPSAWQPVDPKGFGPWTREYVVQDGVSEDCLYLNVWAPSEPGDKLWPVLVWIHGGAFFQGSGSVPIYNGEALAAQGVVVVTLNYRLGVLGFLAHPDLAHEAASSATAAPGNFGLQDQLAALQWVQTHIAAFGGDATAVTIAGQSAGAVSVHMLVASPLAKGLFRGAIAQSGPPSLMPIKSLDQAQADGLAFAADLHAPDIQALRALPVEDLTRCLNHHTAPVPPFMPMVDGVLVSAWPPQSCDIAYAHWPNDVPMLVGQTADENSGLDPDYGSEDPAAFAALMQRCCAPVAQELSAQYLQATGGDVGAAYRQASLDRWLGALWWWAKHRCRVAQAPVFVYHFDHVQPGPEAHRYRAFHSSEVPYVLATLSAAPHRNFTDTDRQVSANASAYWLNFVRHGNPNGEGLPRWPAFVFAAPNMLRIGPHIGAVPMLLTTAADACQQQLRRCGSIPLFP